MGDKSPKAKNKAKKQDDAVKTTKKDAAYTKAHPPEVAGGKKGK